MGLGDASGGQRFPVSADVAWTHLKRIAPRLGTVKETDEFLRRVVYSTGMSLMSFGENVIVSIEEDGAEVCRVTVSSGLKVGANWAGGARSNANVDKVISALSTSIQRRRS